MPEANQPPAATRARQTVLVVEDNDIYRSVVLAALEQYLQEADLIEAVSVKDALRALAGRHVDAMVADMTLPDGTAITLLDAAQSFVSAGLKVVIFSNHSREDMLPLLDRQDVHAYVEKAQGPRHLALAIQEVSGAGVVG